LHQSMSSGLPVTRLALMSEHLISSFYYAASAGGNFHREILLIRFYMLLISFVFLNACALQEWEQSGIPSGSLSTVSFSQVLLSDISVWICHLCFSSFAVCNIKKRDSRNVLQHVEPCRFFYDMECRAL
jgi:hypothetical protein